MSSVETPAESRRWLGLAVIAAAPATHWNAHSSTATMGVFTKGTQLINSRNSMAANATLHCLTGCAIGEIAGLMIGTALVLQPYLWRSASTCVVASSCSGLVSASPG
jgi:hypothetical protein